MLSRRSRYEGPTGIATIVMDAARRRGMASCNVRGQAPPHYLGNTTNPAVSRALLLAVAPCSPWNWMGPPSRRPCRPFGPNVTRPSRKTPPSRPMFDS